CNNTISRELEEEKLRRIETEVKEKERIITNKDEEIDKYKETITNLENRKSQGSREEKGDVSDVSIKCIGIKCSWYIFIKGKLSCCACDQTDPKESKEAWSKGTHQGLKLCAVYCDEPFMVFTFFLRNPEATSRSRNEAVARTQAFRPRGPLSS
ncbi:hypothetical protein RhiirA5_441979, partial [Rhizophagus irregularis]